MDDDVRKAIYEVSQPVMQSDYDRVILGMTIVRLETKLDRLQEHLNQIHILLLADQKEE